MKTGLLICLLISFQSFSQEKVWIKGRVSDPKNESVADAVLFVYSMDSTLLAMAVSEKDGSFEADQYHHQQHHVMVSVHVERDQRRHHGRKHYKADWVQVSRLGNPLINEVIIPIGMKDKFNATSPANDAKNFGRFALNPEPARILNALFGLGVQETNRTVG